MDPELTPPELPLMAAAVALGAVCAMVAVLLLFPIIDRFIRPRFDLERGGAMIVLLVTSLLIGTIGGFFGFFWLRDREKEELDRQPQEVAALLAGWRAAEDGAQSQSATEGSLTTAVD